jgi:hypothetical protein
MVVLCKASTLRHHERRPMSARHIFTAQTTRQKRLSHGDNAVAYFFCCSVYQREPKHLIPSSIHWQCKQAFCSRHVKGLASFWAPWNTCAENHASDTSGGVRTTCLPSVTSSLQYQIPLNLIEMISIMLCSKIQHWSQIWRQKSRVRISLGSITIYSGQGGMMQIEKVLYF